MAYSVSLIPGSLAYTMALINSSFSTFFLFASFSFFGDNHMGQNTKSVDGKRKHFLQIRLQKRCFFIIYEYHFQGYNRGSNLHGAPYDFRKAAHEHEDYFSRVKSLIEETFLANGETSVIILTHSLGSPMMLYFLLHQVVTTPIYLSLQYL